MKIVLAFPAEKRHLADHSTGLLPLGLLSMASGLSLQGHEVTVAHLGPYRRRDAIRIIMDGEPDMVGLSCFTFQRSETFRIAAAVREAGGGKRPFIVLGGPHAAPLADELLKRVPAVDAVATGEGERTVADLAERLQRGVSPAGIAGLVVRQGEGITDGGPVPLVDNLDDLPTVTKSSFPILGVSIPYQMRHIMASRGCSARCVFCCAPDIWGRRVRRRSVESLMAEIAELRRLYGCVFLSFRDDTFTADSDWIREFCRRLIDSGGDVLWDCQTRVTAIDGQTADLMRLAGCVQVQMGVESGSDRILQFIRKPFNAGQALEAVSVCRDAGLLVSLYLICGVPGEEEDDIRLTEELVRQARPSSVSIARLCLYPGAPIAAHVPPDRWFLEEADDLYASDEPASLRHLQRLQALERAVSGTKPFTASELKAVAGRLTGPATALAVIMDLDDRGRLEEAEKACNDLLEAWPGYPWGELELGELLLEQGRAGEAESHLRQVMTRVSRWPYPVDRLGWCLRLLGREREGDSLIVEALQLDPGTPSPPPPGRHATKRRIR